jgi:hypothetical protein
LDIARYRKRMRDEQLVGRAEPMNTGVAKVGRAKYFIELANSEQSLGGLKATIHMSILGRGLLMCRSRESPDISHGL